MSPPENAPHASIYRTSTQNISMPGPSPCTSFRLPSEHRTMNPAMDASKFCALTACWQLLNHAEVLPNCRSKGAPSETRPTQEGPKDAAASMLLTTGPLTADQRLQNSLKSLSNPLKAKKGNIAFFWGNNEINIYSETYAFS